MIVTILQVKHFSIVSNTVEKMERGEQVSKMKEWLLDKQENGDDGTGFNDYIEEEESNERANQRISIR
jgi:hypothetical protein